MTHRLRTSSRKKAASKPRPRGSRSSRRLDRRILEDLNGPALRERPLWENPSALAKLADAAAGGALRSRAQFAITYHDPLDGPSLAQELAGRARGGWFLVQLVPFLIWSDDGSSQECRILALYSAPLPPPAASSLEAEGGDR